MSKYLVLSRSPGEDWKEVKTFRDEIVAKNLAKSIEITNHKETKIIVVKRKK